MSLVPVLPYKGEHSFTKGQDVDQSQGNSHVPCHTFPEIKSREDMTMSQKSKWELVDSILTGTMPLGTTVSFDMLGLFPSELWDLFDDVQKADAAYGAKQGLMDHTARNADATLTEDERVKAMQARWTLWTVDRKWTSGKREGGFSVRVLKEDKTTATLAEMVEKGEITQKQMDAFLAVGKKVSLIK
jgi:hypothetical protein